MLTEAVLAPVAVGENLTVMVQFAPAASVGPQVLVWEKSPALVPVIPMLAIDSVDPPELVKVVGKLVDVLIRRLP